MVIMEVCGGLMSDAYWRLRHRDLDDLRHIRGVGVSLVRILRHAGYTNVAQVYYDSATCWGRLARIPGIGRDTAANLFRRILEEVD